MKNPIHKRFVNVITVVLALASITLVTACSQKPTAAENAAQIQAAVDKAVGEAKQQFIADQQAAEKTKQDAAEQAAEQAKEQAKQKRKQEEIAAAEKRQRVAEQHRAAANARSEQVMASRPTESKAVCANCGVVLSINPVEKEGKGSGLGVVAGGVLGGLLGNQVGNGTGRDLATIAGVVGGAVAGNKVEKNAKKATSYDITVKMDDGEMRTFNQATPPDLAIEQKVRIENDAIVKF
ncbi:MAG: glycine zipper 2TM domain-containing protein [Gallionella sp.]